MVCKDMSVTCSLRQPTIEKAQDDDFDDRGPLLVQLPVEEQTEIGQGEGRVEGQCQQQ